MSTPINIPMLHVAGLTFRADCLVAVDISNYEQGIPERSILFVLAGPYETEFIDERADEAYLWYLNFTGQNRIEKPSIVNPFAKIT